jgi:hypothetical protein
MRLLIAIDDTDNKDTRGTGFRARELAARIEEQHLGKVNGITRHQLFVHDDIAYTSQNSSACLDVDSTEQEKLKELSKKFLMEVAAPGSDAGLCIVDWENVNQQMIDWGVRAKKEVLYLDEALKIAQQNNIYLEGFTGLKIGQIGALAAVGLRKAGNDGRFIWLKGTGELRDFDSGIYSVKDLKKKAGIGVIRSMEGKDMDDSEVVLCEGWTRPVLLQNMAVLLVEKVKFTDYGWKTVDKNIIRTKH